MLLLLILYNGSERWTAPGAIDVETANSGRSSICAIGIVHVKDGRIAERRKIEAKQAHLERLAASIRFDASDFRREELGFLKKAR